MMPAKAFRWMNYFSNEWDEYNQIKLREDTPEEIKKEYEEYKKEEKNFFLKNLM